MKKLILSLALLVAGAFAFSQEVEIIAVADYEDPSGFSGYGWGSSYKFIRKDMAEEGYVLLYSTERDLWYRGNINGEWLQIIYYFEHGVLTSGMLIINDVDQPSFWVVNEYLQDMYDTNVDLTVKNDNWIEAEMRPRGANAWIIHSLDVELGSHTVHYYYRRGEE